MKVFIFLCLAVSSCAALPHSIKHKQEHPRVLDHAAAQPDQSEEQRLQRRLQEVEAELVRARSDIKALAHNLRAMRVAEHTERSEPETLIPEVPESHALLNISFSAYQDGNLVDVPEGETVMFSYIEYASSANFNPATSLFTCSEDGAHFFNAAVAVSECTPTSGDLCRVAIIRNDALIAGATAHRSDSYAMLSMSVVTDCQKGDHVFVRVRAGDVRIEGSDVGRESRFSGFFLHQS